jgi:TonB family protein
MIALSLHPAVGAPPDPAAGNRRGTFAATPAGRAGASGTPAAATGSGNGTSASTTAGKSEVPPGLYVGKAEKSTPVAGTGNTPAASVNPNLIADARPPRVSSTPARPADSGAKLSEPERAIFSGRKYYSLTLNMPNLNSAGGSWVVHFAEAKPEPALRDGTRPAVDISQPIATRKVDPAYPLQLMRQNVAGTVILYAVIRADGSVGDVKVLRGVEDRLDRFASDAVAQWKFAPATKNGVPVDVEATFQIPFRPSRIGTSF